MSLFTVVLCFFTWIAVLTGATNYEEEKSIGPVATCTGELSNADKVVKSCYARCLMDPEPADRATVYIQQIKPNVEGPSVIECIKIKQTQVFTRTWTFSDIKGPVTHEVLPVSREECDEAIRQNCPDRICNHREMDELPEEYHYASDFVKTATTISLLSMSSTIKLSGDEMLISPITAEGFVSIAEGTYVENGKLYAWDRSFRLGTCPFEGVKSYGCDKYVESNGDYYYLCSGGRFSVTPQTSKEPDMSSACPGLKRSQEGFIYELGGSIDTGHNYGRLSVSSADKAAADKEFYKHKIQQIATHLDAEICTNQCELMTMEARINTKNGFLVRVGGDYFKMFSNNTVQKCKALHGCRIPALATYCGNPVRIGLSCTEGSGLWDPTSPELGSGGSCLKPDTAEKLTIMIGSEKYVVDDDLRIRINLSEHHGIYANNFGSFHMSGIQLTVSSMAKLKPDWSSAKDSKKGFSRTSTEESVLRTPSLAVGSFVVDTWHNIVSGVQSVEHAIGVTIMAMGCGAVALVVWKLRSAAVTSAARQYVAVATPEPATTWI